MAPRGRGLWYPRRFLVGHLRQWKLPIPQLPIGDPEPDAVKKTQVSSLVDAVLELEQRIVAARRQRGERKRNWEQQLVESDASLSDLSQDLIAHYSFDQIDELRITNDATEKLDAEHVGSEAIKQVAGVVGNAVELTEGSFVNAGQIFQPERDLPFTIGCWFRQNRESTGNRRLKSGVLIAKSSSSEHRGVHLEHA